MLPILLFILGCKQDKTGEYLPKIVMDIPGRPFVFEMNVGETVRLEKKDNKSSLDLSIRITDFIFYYENNLWFPDTIPQENIYRADVFVEINGKPEILIKQAYQFPQEFSGLRWYVETLVGWETSSQVDAETDLEKDLRISVRKVGEPWGFDDLVYPIRNYRWHASSYMNTWSALVPYNHLYYHRGEDMAAIPDKYDVLALFNGRVIISPYPDGDGRSNSLSAEGEDGFGFRLAHMNTESILPTSAQGMDVKTGQILGKTGETWDGYKSQHTGPHLHVELAYKGTRISSYPYLMEAYFRDYPDQVLAIAGGYRFGIVGDTITLDGSRSLARPGEKMSEMYWITHFGDTVENEMHHLVYNRPGLYSEQLIVQNDEGEIDRDFLQVRIFDPEKDGHDIVCRHVHYWPVRDIHPGDSVLFWNRLVNNVRPVRIDFGDGRPSEIVEDEIWHVYNYAGNYVVTFDTCGKDDEPATIQLEVVVE